MSRLLEQDQELNSAMRDNLEEDKDAKDEVESP